MRGMLMAAAALAGLACAGTSTALSAASSAATAGNVVQAGAHQTVTTHKTTRKIKRSKVGHPQTNWLNPQPEPPSPAGGTKPVQGGNWLNPQPEPPRPDTTKKLH